MIKNILLLLFFIPTYLIAQDKIIYKLNRVVRDKEQKNEILDNWYDHQGLYNESVDQTAFIIGMHYYLNSKFDSTLKYYEPIIERYKKDAIFLEAVRYKGIIQDRTGDTYGALSTYRSIENLPELKNNPFAYLIYLNTVGVAYENLSQYDSAILIYKYAISFSDEVDNRIFKMNLFYTTSSAYLGSFEYDSAMVYADSCLSISLSFKKRTKMTYQSLLLMSKISEEINTAAQTLKIYDNLLQYNGEIDNGYIRGQAYLHKYNLLKDQVDSINVNLLYNAKKILEPTGDKLIFAEVLQGLSLFHLDHQNLDSAQYYCDKAIDVIYRPRINKYLASAYSTKAKVLLAQNNLKEALEYSEKAYNYIGNQVSRESINFFETHHAILKESKMWEKAHTVAEQIIKLKTDYIENNSEKKLAQQQFAFDKKIVEDLARRRRAEEVEKKQKYIYSSILLTIILCISIYFGLRIYKAKKIITTTLGKVDAQKVLIEKQKDELEAMDEVKNKFFTHISHEFRTPLTLIKGPAKELEQNLSGEQNLLANLIRTHADRLLTHINQILDLASLRNSKTALELTLIHYTSFLKIFRANYESLFDAKATRFEVKRIGQVKEGFLDVEKMETILNNLVVNASKYTEGGEVLVTFEGRKDELKVIVKDTGKGIPETHLAHIFNEYFNDPSENTSTGLGLAICKELVSTMGGNIEVESQENIGTCFTLSIPTTLESLQEKNIRFTVLSEREKRYHLVTQMEETIKSDDLRSDPSEKKEETILIVDDNKDIRSYLKQILSKNYNVLTAENGREGVRKAIKNQPDVIISDLMMPELNGHEMLKEIRENELSSHIPVIMLTAKGDDTTRLESLKLEADEFLVKPFDKEEVLQRLKNLISYKKRLFKQYANLAFHEEKVIELPSLEQQFLNRVNKAIENNLDNPAFGVEELTIEVGISRTQLHRKLKGLLNESTSNYLRRYRLYKAYNDVVNTDIPISEIADKYGFNSLSYFTKSFKEQYALSPTELRKKENKKSTP